LPDRQALLAPITKSLRGHHPKKDFSNRITIAYREARESFYWLRMLKELYDDELYKKDFDKFIQEADELKRIFVSIKLSAKS